MSDKDKEIYNESFALLTESVKDLIVIFSKTSGVILLLNEQVKELREQLAEVKEQLAEQQERR